MNSSASQKQNQSQKSKEVQYGLGGLIDVIKMSDKDVSDLV